MIEELTISLEEMFRTARFTRDCTNEDLTAELRISMEVFAQLERETVRSVPAGSRHRPDDTAFQRLCDRYDLDAQQRKDLAYILYPPQWDDPKAK